MAPLAHGAQAATAPPFSPPTYRSSSGVKIKGSCSARPPSPEHPGQQCHLLSWEWEVMLLFKSFFFFFKCHYCFAGCNSMVTGVTGKPVTLTGQSLHSTRGSKGRKQ